MVHKQHAEQWQLARNSAEAYEKYLVPVIFAPGARELIQFSGLKPGDKILDLACGTGIVARIAHQCMDAQGSIKGLDINESMLEVAKDTSKTLSPPIAWYQGDATHLPFEENSLDIVFCQQALQFFPDRSQVLQEILRMLKPGGKAAVSVLRSLEKNPGYKILAGLLDRHVGKEAGTMMRSPFPPWEKDRLLNEFTQEGFKNLRLRISIGSVRYPSPEEFLKQEAASSPLSGPLSEINPEVKDQLVSELTQALRDYIDDEGIVFPAETYLVLAHK